MRRDRRKLLMGAAVVSVLGAGGLDAVAVATPAPHGARRRRSAARAARDRRRRAADALGPVDAGEARRVDGSRDGPGRGGAQPVSVSAEGRRRRRRGRRRRRPVIEAPRRGAGAEPGRRRRRRSR